MGKTQVFNNGATMNAQVGWAFRGRTYNTLETVRASRQGKYGLLDARIVWNLPNERTSIALWGTNLLDREYFNTAIDLSSGPSRSGTITKYWGEPQRYGLEITHRMGR